MKTIFVLLIALCTLDVQAATANRDELTRDIVALQQSTARAAARFLNKDAPVAERLEVIRPYALIYDPKQIEGFANVVLDDSEHPEIRAAALARLYAYIPQNQRLRALQLAWLSDPSQPRELRMAALDAEAALSFSLMDVPEVYQKMLSDPELPIRVFAFTKLVIHGDARAQQLLIRGLESRESAPLPPATALGILSMAVKKEHYPAAFKLLQTTTDDAVRLEAIRSLGLYPEARPKLIEISRDPKEKLEFREAALGSLFAGDRENIVQQVTPILADPNAPARLKAGAIQMTIDVRQTMAYRSKAKRADSYDRLIQKLAAESPDAEVRTVANQYMQAVRPRF